MVVRRAPAGNSTDLANYVRAYLIRNGFWLTVNGTLNALRYGAILRARKPVSIVGLDSQYNGTYYVRKVVHTLTFRHYEMQFEAVRNRSGESGPTDTSGLENPSSTSLPIAAGPGADTDVVTVRESGAQVAPA